MKLVVRPADWGRQHSLSIIGAAEDARCRGSVACECDALAGIRQRVLGQAPPIRCRDLSCAHLWCVLAIALQPCIQGYLGLNTGVRNSG